MWRRCLLKNRFYAITIVFLGALSVPVTWDATFLLFSVIMGLVLFFHTGGSSMGRAEIRRAKKSEKKRENRYI